MSLDRILSRLQTMLRDCERLMGELAPDNIDGQDRVVFARLQWSARNLSEPKDMPEANQCLGEVEALHASLLGRRQMELRAVEDERQEVEARQAEAALFAVERTPQAGTTSKWGATNQTGAAADSQGPKMDVGWLKESLSGSIEKCRILLSELESIYTASEDAVNYSRIRWTLNDLSTRGGNANDKASLTNYLKEVLNLRDNLLQGITIFYEEAGEPVPQHIREAARLTVPNQTAQSKTAVRFSTNGGPAAAVKIVVPPAVSLRSSSPRPQPFTQQPGMKKENTFSSSPPDQRQTRPDAASNNRPFSPKIAAILSKSARNMRDTSDIGNLQAIFKTLVVDCQLLMQQVDVDRLPANDRADYSRRLWTSGQAELRGSPVQLKRALLAQIEDIANLKSILLEHTGGSVPDFGQAGNTPSEMQTTPTMNGSGHAAQPSPTRNWASERPNAPREQSPYRRPTANAPTNMVSGGASKQPPARFTPGSTSTPPPPPSPPPPPPPSFAPAATKTAPVREASPHRVGGGRGLQMEPRPDKTQPLVVQIMPYDDSPSGHSPMVEQQKAMTSLQGQDRTELSLADTLKPSIGSTVEENQQVVDEYMQLLQFKNGWPAAILPHMEAIREVESDSDDLQMILPSPPSPAPDVPSPNKIPMSETDEVLRGLREHSPVRTRIDQFQSPPVEPYQPKNYKIFEDSMHSNYNGNYDVLPPSAAKRLQARRGDYVNGHQSSTPPSFQMSSPKAPQKVEPSGEVSRHNNGDTNPLQSETARNNRSRSKTARTPKHYVMLSPCENLPAALSVVVGGSAPSSHARRMRGNVRFVCEHIYQQEHVSRKEVKQP